MRKAPCLHSGGGAVKKGNNLRFTVYCWLTCWTFWPADYLFMTCPFCCLECPIHHCIPKSWGKTWNTCWLDQMQGWFSDLRRHKSALGAKEVWSWQLRETDQKGCSIFPASERSAAGLMEASPEEWFASVSSSYLKKVEFRVVGMERIQGLWHESHPG